MAFRDKCTLASICLVSWQVLGALLLPYAIDRKDVAQYAKEILPQRVEELAHYLRVETPSVPELRSQQPTHFGAYKRAGYYDGDRNVLSLDFTTHYAPNMPVAQIVSSTLFLSEFPPVQRTLDHEIVHYLTDVIAERNGINDIFDPADPNSVLPLRILFEGIARYVERRDAYDCVEPQWPDSWESPKFEKYPLEFIYSGGCAIVGPIIDRYRGEGILYLIQHPPKVHSPLLLPQYRAQALRDLDRASNENL